MRTGATTAPGAAAAPPRRMSTGRLAVRLLLHRGLFMFGAVVIIIMVLVAIFAPLLAPYNPYEPDMQNALAPPSAEHWLGTDPIGRDTLSRLIYGTRTSLVVGLSAVAAAVVARRPAGNGGRLSWRRGPDRHHAGHRHPHGDTHVASCSHPGRRPWRRPEERGHRHLHQHDPALRPPDVRADAHYQGEGLRGLVAQHGCDPHRGRSSATSCRMPIRPCSSSAP